MISKLAATYVSAETQTNSPRTTRNAVQSPLLSLPTELLDMILEWAYGDCQVVVSAASEIGAATMSLANKRKAPVPVCQQFWRSASDVFYSSCDFVFDHPITLRSFALSPSRYSVVSRVKRITIEPGYNGTNSSRDDASQHLADWAIELTAIVVGRFRSLEGLRMIELSARPPYSGSRGDPTDVMHHPCWRRSWVANMICAFQQHKLKAELIDIVLINTIVLREGKISTKYKSLSMAIRKELLKHTPVRRSNRLALEA